MVEVRFLVMEDEGNGRSGVADVSVAGEECAYHKVCEEAHFYPRYFPTYEEAHAHLHKLRQDGNRRDYCYGLFVDVAIISGGCDIMWRESKCTFEQEATK